MTALRYFSPFSLSLLCSVLGGVFGPGVTGVSAATSGPEEDLKTSIKEFTKVYELVENNFADKVTSDKGIYKGAIPGMLRTLDPHSNFFDPKDFQSLRDDQSGHYYGVGMQVAPRNGKTIVVAPFGGSPAYKAGLRPGDADSRGERQEDRHSDHHRSGRPAEGSARHARPGDRGARRLRQADHLRHYPR